MSEHRYIVLENRGLLAVGGDEARPFLQGLISNDIDKVSAARAIYATLLTRKPTGGELSDWAGEVRKRDVEACKDLIWILANSHEFRFIR